MPPHYRATSIRAGDDFTEFKKRILEKWDKIQEIAVTVPEEIGLSTEDVYQALTRVHYVRSAFTVPCLGFEYSIAVTRVRLFLRLVRQIERAGPWTQTRIFDYRRCGAARRLLRGGCIARSIRCCYYRWGSGWLFFGSLPVTLCTADSTD